MTALRLEILTRDEWQVLAPMAHVAVFEEAPPSSLSKIDYAMLVTTDDKKIVGYVTVRDASDDVCYWQYGGVFDLKNKLRAVRAFELCLGWAANRYRRITTLVKNTNAAYLRLCLAEGFLVTGTRLFDGDLLVELHLDFEG